MWITPNYQDTDFSRPLTIDEKITIFLDRTYGWQLDIADQCINGKKGVTGESVTPIQHSGFAVLHIVLSYFEMVAKYQDGFMTNGKSEYYFKQGVYSVFPQLKTGSSRIVDSLLDTLYFGARCGLYHGGMTDQRVIITSETAFPMVFDLAELRLKINPHFLVPALKTHLEDYGKQLQDPHNSGLRRNFEKRFDFDALNCANSDGGVLITKSHDPANSTYMRDILKPNLQVVFCSIAGSDRKGSQFGLYYPDYRNRFWAVLHRIGLTPRLFTPKECRILPRYGIGLTALAVNGSGAASNPVASQFDIKGLHRKIQKLSPSTVAFNGKRAAEEFYGYSVHYGPQPEPVRATTLFVLPSTSGIARRYWNEGYWRELADFVKSKKTV